MKIPKYIIAKMHRVAKLSREASVLSKEIEDFFVKQGYDVYELRSGNGKSLEELEYGNDVTDEFVADIESGVYDTPLF